MTAVVDEHALMHLNVGDFVAIMTHNMKDGNMHWTLGSVETPPYLRDVEIRLWERQRTEYYNEDVTPTNPETAELMKRIAQVKEDLQKSIAQSEDLTQQLRGRRASIMQQIAEADQYVAESNVVRNAARDDVESIPDRDWRELKSYRIPPKVVSVVIRAVMLLLSEDEARTWSQMQRVLRDFNFKRRITAYDPQQLSPERRDYILQECVSKKSFRYDRAMQGSVAVGPIYYWVLAQLDCGEAQSQKDRVNEEKMERQKELREVLKQISEQQKRISEYQELMDDLDDQLRMCNQHNDSSVSRSRRRSVAGGDRYADSFAAREGKGYLKPAFFTWKPTDRVIIVLRKNIVCNFNGVTTREQEEGYNLSDPQIRSLDDSLLRLQEAADGMSEADDDLEDDMFRQDEDALNNAPRNDEDIMKERELQAGEGGAVPSSDVKAQLQRKFEGKNWQRVLDRKRNAIEAAFAEESAECLQVPEYYISIEDLTIGSLIVDFTAQHDGRRSTRELQSCVDACGYPRVLSLYEEDDEEGEEEGPGHQMKFGGDHWADFAPAHRQEIEKAFLIDTSAATGVEQEGIEVQDIRVEEGEGLTIDYSMADKSCDPEQVQEQVDAYSYPEVWALYQRLAGLDEVGPTHQVRFRGERWADIMEDNKEVIKAAFAEDTAAALGISARQARPGGLRYEGGLTVPYTISGCSLDDDEVDQKAEDYSYPKMWALYDRLVAEAVGADYQKAFDGEHWETVLQVARPEVSEAFCTDTANAVKSAPGQVVPRSVDTDQDRLLISYNVGGSHLRAEAVREDTREYPYPEVWALYQQVVAEEDEGTTNLSQRFDGEAWEAINNAIGDQVRQAFTNDVAAATGANPRCILVHDIKTSKKGMTIEYGVLREEGESAHCVCKATKEWQYPNLWALYEENKDSGAPRGFGGTGERESGILERRF
ncbi:putative mitotubule-associated protein Gb4, partial [Leptomonas seymouri]